MNLRSRLIRYAAFLFFPFAGCAGLTSHDPALTQRLDEILDREWSTGAVVHARVIELPAGRELYARLPDAPATPASNMKLFTSAAGLDALGIDHVFKTYLAYDGSDLWIVGTGDPGLGDSRIEGRAHRTTMSVLDDWAAALTQRGIKQIPGDLVYYAEAFESRTVHPNWPADDLQYWYGAPVGGLNFNDNCIDFAVAPAADGAPANYTLTPPVSGVTVINQCVSGDSRPPTVEKVPYADVYILGGGCTKKATLRSKPVGDPAAFLADAFRTRLAAAGITIAGKVRSEPAPLGRSMPPPAAQTIAVHENSMRDVLARINTNSQNMFAEALYKYAGADRAAGLGRNDPGSWALGRAAVQLFLDIHHIDRRGMNLVDGSGLARENRVTTRAVTELLRCMNARADGEAFRRSMATPGKESSLGDRLKDLDGRLWVKTGYVGGTRALSGYLQTKPGRWLAFSIIYNDIPGGVKPFERLQDEAVRVLAEWPIIPAKTAPPDEKKEPRLAAAAISP